LPHEMFSECLHFFYALYAGFYGRSLDWKVGP
jgi:hypothetical protein